MNTEHQPVTHPISDKLSLKRLAAVLNRFVMLNRWRWLLVMAIFVGLPVFIFIILNIFTAFESRSDDSFSGWMQLYIFAGLLLSSHLFDDIHKPATSWQLHLLPATPAEKYIGAWLISAPIYTLAAMLIISVTTMILFGIESLMGGSAQIKVFNPFTDLSIRFIWLYLLLNSFFLTCSIRFNKMPFINSLLLLIVIGFLVTAVIALIVWATGLMGGSVYLSAELDRGVSGVMVKWLSTLFWILLTGYLLSLGHHMLKTKQVAS